MQTVGEESAIWDRGKCPSLCCKDFFMTFLTCRFILMCSVCSHSSAITWKRVGTADARVTESEGVEVVVC
jgi:hypothetical protein